MHVTLAPFLLAVMAVLPVPQATLMTRSPEETPHDLPGGQKQEGKKEQSRCRIPNPGILWRSQ